MQCGNCREHHDTVAEVRNCYGTQPVGEFLEPDRITEKQLSFINRLLRERDRTELPDGSGDEPQIKMGKREASEIISDLLRTPRDQGPKPPRQEILFSDGEDFTISQVQPPGPEDPQLPSAQRDGEQRRRTPQKMIWDIPAGHYAIPAWVGYSQSPCQMQQDLSFYRVDKPTTGKWAGYTFVKWVIGGKPHAPLHGNSRIYEVLKAIEASPAEAAWKYGQEIRNCDKCNRHLTDKISRAYSRGPDCREKYGSGFYREQASA